MTDRLASRSRTKISGACFDPFALLRFADTVNDDSQVDSDEVASSGEETSEVLSDRTNLAAAVVSEDTPYPSTGYAWYVVAVLMVIYVFSFMDRQILALLTTPIKKQLEISDSQMSYLGGASFAIF